MSKKTCCETPRNGEVMKFKEHSLEELGEGNETLKIY